MGLNPSDRKYDPNQRLQTPAKNQPIGANLIRQIKHLILNTVQAGPGVRVERSGERVFISTLNNGRGLGSTGGGGATMYTATTKAGLPSGVAETSLGRVTAGADQGVMYVRNVDNDGWDAINRLE